MARMCSSLNELSRDVPRWPEVPNATRCAATAASGAGLPAIGLIFTPLPSPRRRAGVRCSSVVPSADIRFALVVPRSAVKKCKSRAIFDVWAPRLLFTYPTISPGAQMGGFQRTLRILTVSGALLTVGACNGGLGNILGGVLGGGTQQQPQSGQINGIVRSVDPQNQRINVQDNSSGQRYWVQYDNRTQVVY